MIDTISRQRMEANEAVFRAKNEEVAQGLVELESIAKSTGQEDLIVELDSSLLFFCECSDENCRERIQIKPSIYAKLHNPRDHFIILPGHEVTGIETVVKKHKDYHVVKKHITPPEDPGQLMPTPVSNA